MQLNQLFFGALLASQAEAILYITGHTPRELQRFGTVSRCVDRSTYYEVRVSTNGLPPIDGTRCGLRPTDHIITRPRSGDVGRCRDDDYTDTNGSKWKFCPDNNGGGRLENMGVTPWFYRQCYPERGGYIVESCWTPCTSSVLVKIWCHDQLFDWKNGKMKRDGIPLNITEMIATEEAWANSEEGKAIREGRLTLEGGEVAKA